MKKALLFLVVMASLSLALVACRSQEPAAPAPAPTAPPAAPAVAPTVAAPAPAPTAPTAAPAAPPVSLESKRYGGNLKVVAQASIKSLDCDFTSAYVCGAVHMHYQEGLLALDDSFNPKPQLVEKWDVAKDGKSYTFTLRQGSSFHNGNAVTTDDVAASLDRFMIRQSSGKAIKKALADPGIVKVNDQTFTINLTKPFSPLITHLGLLRARAIMWPKEVAVLPPAEDVGVKNYIGTGPYKLSLWEVGNKVVLERNEKYAPRSDAHSNFAGGQIPYLDKITWLEIPAEETKIAGLKTGEWDIVDGASLDFYKEMVAHPDIEVALDKPGKKSAIVFNGAKPPTDNVKFRQAVLAAVNPAAYMAALGPQDLWTLCATFFHCGTPLESHVGDAKYNQKNIELAKQLLTESGYKGEPVVFMNPSDYGTITPLGPVFRQQMEAIGINIETPAMDWATLISRIGDLKYWNVHSTWHGFYGVHDPINDGWVTGTARTGYESPAMLAAAEGYTSALDPKERARYVDEIERIFWEDVPYLGFGQFFATSPYRTWVKNFTVIKGMPNYNNVWIEKP